MQAVGFRRYGGPESLDLMGIPEPPTGPQEIRIQVEAAPINPADLLFLGGGLEGVVTGQPPYVGGLELAGTVVDAGPEAGWSIGDRVMAMTKFIPHGRGAHAESVVVHGDSAAPIPVNASAIEASTVPMNGLTALLALRRLSLPPEAILVVTGAAGAVGGYVVQLAVRAGISVVAVASQQDEAFLRRCGVRLIVDRDDDVVAAIRAQHPEGVDAVVDAAVLGPEIVPVLASHGRFIALRAFPGSPDRDIVAETISVRDFLRAREELEHLRRLTEAGTLALRVDRTFTPDRAAEGFRRLAAGGTRGRQVLVF